MDQTEIEVEVRKPIRNSVSSVSTINQTQVETNISLSEVQLIQDWVMEKSVHPKVVGTEGAISIPFGKTCYLSPPSMDQGPVTLETQRRWNDLQQCWVRNLLATYTLGKTGNIWMSLYSCSNKTVIITGRTGAVILRTTGNKKVIDVDGQSNQLGRSLPVSTVKMVPEPVLDDEEVKLKAQLKSEFPIVFETRSKSKRCDKLMVHESECLCNLQGHVKPQTFPYTLTRDLPQWATERTIDEYLEAGFLEKASADEVDFVSPTMFIRKPSPTEDVKVRLLADLREINVTFRLLQLKDAMCSLF